MGAESTWSGRTRRRPPALIADALVVVGLIAIVAFPLAATVAASDESTGGPVAGAPVTPGPGAAKDGSQPRGPQVRDVPVFVPGGMAEQAFRDRTVLVPVARDRAIDSAADALFGGPGTGAALLSIVRDLGVAVTRTAVRDPAAVLAGNPDSGVYPFRYPALDPVLDRLLPAPLAAEQAARANDLAALLMVAAADQGDGHDAVDPNVCPTGPGYNACAARVRNDYFNNGPAAAFDLLNRSREHGGCLVQLNLAFLVSTDSFDPHDDGIAEEFAKAEAACPGDPTPLHLLADFQSQRAVGNPVSGQQLPADARIRRAFATARRLQQEFPGSPAGLAAEADTELRLAYLAEVPQPFTARNHFRRALDLYRRARTVAGYGHDPGLLAGEARADSALGLNDQAAAIQHQAISSAPEATLEVREIEYLERAQRFRDAAAAATRVVGQAPRFPTGPALAARVDIWDFKTRQNDVEGPISLQLDRLLPAHLQVGPEAGGYGAGVTDLSFLPLFHPVEGVTGYHRWCPEWTRRRDLILSGQPLGALSGGEVHNILDGSPQPSGGQVVSDTTGCPGYPVLLKGVAQFVAGQVAEAKQTISAPGVEVGSGIVDLFSGQADPALAVLHYARENLLRFAGDLPGADQSVAAWVSADPRDAVARGQAGEIAFLRHDYARSAADFSAAIDLYSAGRASTQGPPIYFELNMGTALELAGRALDAQRTLLSPDLAGAANVTDNSYSAYNALVQAGDNELRGRHYAAAVPLYDRAREVEKTLPAPDTLATRAIRPEALQNNQGLVLVKLGRAAEGLSAISEAVATDPENPIFLQNRGFAERQLGHLDAAANSYRAALTGDPSSFPAANDLGVIRARQHRDRDAAAAFRQAIAANHRYPTAWFNLGVLLSRQGAGHLLESQGALASAARLDHGLRSRTPALMFDDDTAVTTLDLSKPLPPMWQFATSSTRTPVAVAGIVMLLMLFRVGRSLATDYGSGDVEARLLRTRPAGWLAGRRLTGPTITPLLAIAAVVSVVIVPLVRAGSARADQVFVLSCIALILTGMLMRVRALLARRAGNSIEHFTWTPGLAIGALGLLLKLSYPPLPAVRGDERPHRFFYWIGPGILFAASLALLLLGHATEVPIARAAGATALAMAATALTPVKPFDGAFLGKGLVALAPTLCVLGLSFFVYAGLL